MARKDKKELSDEEVSEIWTEILGPVYDRDGLERSFGYTTEEIKTMVKEDALLELVTSDGAAFYPASCFDDNGQPWPRLSEVIGKLRGIGIADPWGLAFWLSTGASEWEGRSALELLRTGEWADEVITQVGEHGRSPLWARAWQAEKIAIARPILDRFVELVADLPVDVAEGTLFVTRETEVPYGVFAMSLTGSRRALIPVHFEIDGDVDETAGWLAEEVRRQRPWETPKR
jgi:hypothetical protein